MGRVSVYIVLFMVFFNGGALMLQSTGVSQQMEINAETGNPGAIQDANNRADTVRTGGGFGDTLFGLYQTLGNGLSAIFQVIFPGVDMLANIGFPEPILGYVSSGLTLMLAFDLMSYIPGRDLI